MDTVNHWEPLKVQSSIPFLDFFVSFMEKETSAKFCSILIIFHEVSKVPSFEVTLSPQVNITPHLKKIYGF